MLNKLSYLIAIISIIIFSAHVGVYANTSSEDNPLSFEEQFTQVGYKSVEDAVKEFENYTKSDVKLPTIMPSISFTHKFGRFADDKEYDMNNILQIMFVNKDIRENIFKIDIRPLNNKLDFEGKEFKLEDGSKGIYFESKLFNFFVFEKNNLQYMLGINKKVVNFETPDELVNIANSI